jgi:Protein of unknown function (DUF3017)
MANRPANAGSTSAPEPAPRAARALAWLPYLIVLAIAVGGLYFAWRGPEDAGRGTGLVGCALLAAAVFRLVLPARYAAPLSSRGKAADVLGYAVFGAGVLVLAISLP